MLVLNKLSVAEAAIGKGLPITLQDRRAYAFENPWAMTLDEIIQELRFRSYLTLGLYLKHSPFCAVDCDSYEAVAEAKRLGLVSNFMIKTRRGLHAIFRSHLSKNIPQYLPKMDIICNNCIPLPPVTLDGFERYLLTPMPHADELVLLPRWVQPKPTPPRPIMNPPDTIPDPGRLLARARAYLARVEGAVSGQRGHLKTLTTALKLARLLNRDPDLLWLLLTEYNRRCEPMWSETDLRRKWSESLRMTQT